MSNIFFLLGRQTLLSIAELNQRNFNGELKSQGWYKVENQKQLNFDWQKLLNSLGGVIKVAEELVCCEKPELNFQVKQMLMVQNSALTEVGISCYAEDFSFRRYLHFCEDLKKNSKVPFFYNEKAQVIPSKETFKILRKNGVEINFLKDRGKWILLKTLAVQDSFRYELRDMGRPNRLKRTGMMPPKLAQILINLAGGITFARKIIDPFCGAGTILQEAVLLGITAYGIDIDPRTVKMAQENLIWIKQKKELFIENIKLGDFVLKHGDAVDPNIYKKFLVVFDAVITEGELGANFSFEPNKVTVQSEIEKLKYLYLKAFKAFGIVLKKEGLAVVCFPFWVPEKSAQPVLLSSVVLEQIKKLGFLAKPIFSAGKAASFLYKRFDQFVGREIFVFKKTS